MARSSTTATASGMVWFKGFGPNDMTQSLSMDEKQLKHSAEEVVTNTIKNATDTMRRIINAGGMNETKKGGPRRISDKMYDSVANGSDISNVGGRVKGSYGYADSTPLYTLYQEEGTIGAGRNKSAHSSDGGIAPMHAFAEAQAEAIVFFQDKIDNTKWFPNSKIGMRKW